MAIVQISSFNQWLVNWAIGLADSGVYTSTYIKKNRSGCIFLQSFLTCLFFFCRPATRGIYCRPIFRFGEEEQQTLLPRIFCSAKLWDCAELAAAGRGWPRREGEGEEADPGVQREAGGGGHERGDRAGMCLETTKDILNRAFVCLVRHQPKVKQRSNDDVGTIFVTQRICGSLCMWIITNKLCIYTLPSGLYCTVK